MTSPRQNTSTGISSRATSCVLVLGVNVRSSRMMLGILASTGKDGMDRITLECCSQWTAEVWLMAIMVAKKELQLSLFMKFTHFQCCIYPFASFPCCIYSIINCNEHISATLVHLTGSRCSYGRRSNQTMVVR